MQAILVALLIAAPAAPETKPPVDKPDLKAACEAAARKNAQFLGGPPRARPLGELPPAQLHLTVLREFDGCSVATIRYQGQTYYVPSIGERLPLRPSGGPSRR